MNANTAHVALVLGFLTLIAILAIIDNAKNCDVAGPGQFCLGDSCVGYAKEPKP